jgi:hypothetical protein
VRVDDDNTTATAATCYSIVATKGNGNDVVRGVHEGGYIFGFRREDDGWKFCTMTVISENARNPLFQR